MIYIYIHTYIYICTRAHTLFINEAVFGAVSDHVAVLCRDVCPSRDEYNIHTYNIHAHIYMQYIYIYICIHTHLVCVNMAIFFSLRPSCCAVSRCSGRQMKYTTARLQPKG